MQDLLFTDKMVATVTCEVELMLDQRALTYVSHDVNDYDCLTSNHFLIGRSNNVSQLK